nr:transposase [Streptomyces sp. SID4925]
MFHTRYPDATVNRLCGDGSDVRDEDVAHLPPFLRHHINLLDRYSFRLPDLLAACGRSAPRRGVASPEGHVTVRPGRRGLRSAPRWAPASRRPRRPTTGGSTSGPSSGRPMAVGLGRG